MKTVYLIAFLLLSLTVTSLWAETPRSSEINLDPRQRLVNTFVTKYQLSGKIKNTIPGILFSFSGCTSNQPAVTDTIIMRSNSDSMMDDILDTYSKLGLNLIVKPGLVAFNNVAGEAQDNFSITYLQDFGIELAGEAAYLYYFKMVYYTQSGKLNLEDNLRQMPVDIPHKVISPQTAITCYLYASFRQSFYPPFPELYKEWVDSLNIKPDTSYTSPDKLYSVKLCLIPEYLSGTEEILGLKYAWKLMAQTSGILIAYVDATNGRMRGKDEIYDPYYPVTSLYVAPSFIDQSRAETAFEPMGKCSVSIITQGPLIRRLRLQVFPKDPVTSENWEVSKMQTLACLRSFLKLYSLPGELIDVSDASTGIEFFGQFQQSIHGFRLHHPLNHIEMHYNREYQNEEIAINLEYIYINDLKSPYKILTPESALSVIVPDPSSTNLPVSEFAYKYNGVTNYYPHSAVQPDNGQNETDPGYDLDYDDSVSSLKLVWFDDPRDDVLNFALTYRLSLDGSIYYLNAVTGEILSRIAIRYH